MGFDPKTLRPWVEERLKALLTRARIKIIILFSLLIVLFLIADALPSFFFNKKAFQQRLNEAIDSSALAISYQGVEVSLLRGVRIIGLRVSFDNEFARGRYLLEAPSVYLRKTIFFSPASAADAFANARVIIEGGKLNYYVTADDSDREVLTEVRRLLQKNLNYHVECNDCNFTLHVKDENYFQEITPVKTVYFTVRHSGQEIETLLRYESSAIGDGDFFGKFKSCASSECTDLEGYWYFKPIGLKAPLFNNFQKKYHIQSGIVSGEIAFDRNLIHTEITKRGKTEIVKKPISNFHLSASAKNFVLTQKKQEWYRADSFSINTKMLIEGVSATGYARAALDDYNVNVEFEDLRPDELPAKYSFRVEPQRFSNKTIHLPTHKKITGLENLEVNLSGRKGDKYTKAEANIKISDGNFYLTDENKLPAIKINTAEFSLSEEKLTGTINAAFGASPINFETSGSLELYPVSFKPRIDSLMREHGDVPEQKIFALRGRLTSSLKSPQISLDDVKPFINYWLDDYWQNVREGMHYSWMPSHFKRREYFVRFFQYMDFSMPITIENFDWGEKTPLKGELFFAPQYTGGVFRLSSADGKNWTNISMSYGGDETNAPWYTHNLRLDLKNGYELLRPWLGNDFFEYFSGVELALDNNYNGERDADHYLKATSVTDLVLKRVRLGKWARKKELPLQWDTISVRANRSNGFGTISSVRAENENTIISGYGDYKLFDRELETNLKNTITIK
ncbi:MAG: hypothetical protein LDLANPLL_00737 [Turneriella sp.]|nr:hypothetical protein [Turneriella sp.]